MSLDFYRRKNFSNYVLVEFKDYRQAPTQYITSRFAFACVDDRDKFSTLWSQVLKLHEGDTLILNDRKLLAEECQSDIAAWHKRTLDQIISKRDYIKEKSCSKVLYDVFGTEIEALWAETTEGKEEARKEAERQERETAQRRRKEEQREKEEGERKKKEAEGSQYQTSSAAPPLWTSQQRGNTRPHGYGNVPYDACPTQSHGKSNYSPRYSQAEKPRDSKPPPMGYNDTQGCGSAHTSANPFSTRLGARFSIPHDPQAMPQPRYYSKGFYDPQYMPQHYQQHFRPSKPIHQNPQAATSGPPEVPASGLPKPNFTLLKEGEEYLLNYDSDNLIVVICRPECPLFKPSSDRRQCFSSVFKRNGDGELLRKFRRVPHIELAEPQPGEHKRVHQLIVNEVVSEDRREYYGLPRTPPILYKENGCEKTCKKSSYFERF
ncbi:hypothetical protein BDV96DRAFT_594360 [Lophiotrema nucula]|uniref:Uncharacterized protein n=1 Tax=Lophiotrema nucula TaxID=690887 RepID=A0A6A5ZQ55_9PLEO|nr:hypothetical protein BDV96DRAFT_594360 [Lophiotrema nucula]